MKKIIITAEDGIVATLVQLLLGEHVNFTVHSVEDAKASPAPPAERKVRSDKDRPRKTMGSGDRTLDAVLQAGVNAGVNVMFTRAAAEEQAIKIGLAPKSVSSALSRAAKVGWFAHLGTSKYCLTEKGLKAALDRPNVLVRKEEDRRE